MCLEQGRGSKQQKCDPVTLHWYKLGCRALLKLYVFGVACLKAEKKGPESLKTSAAPVERRNPAVALSRRGALGLDLPDLCGSSVRTNNLSLIPGGPSGVCICAGMCVCVCVCVCACTRMPHCPHSQLSIFQILWPPFAPACPHGPTPVLLFDVFLHPSRPLSASLHPPPPPPDIL